jgi:hypothetical protein
MSLNGMWRARVVAVAAAEYHLGGSDASPKAICEWISSSSFQHSLMVGCAPLIDENVY